MHENEVEESLSMSDATLKTRFVHAGQALLKSGWADDVRIGIEAG